MLELRLESRGRNFLPHEVEEELVEVLAGFWAVVLGQERLDVESDFRYCQGRSECKGGEGWGNSKKGVIVHEFHPVLPVP